MSELQYHVCLDSITKDYSDELTLSPLEFKQVKCGILVLNSQICESFTSGPSHATDITREVGISTPKSQSTWMHIHFMNHQFDVV